MDINDVIPILCPAQILAIHLTTLYVNTTTLTEREATQKAFQDVKEIQDGQPDGIITAEIVDKWVRQVGISTHNIWNPTTPDFSDGSLPTEWGD